MTQTRKGTLLIVDDEPLKRATLDIELTAAGYSVVQASDPAAALAHLEQQPVDVVVTDWRMPGMDGMQLLDHIKGRWPRTQVILMTAYGSVDAAVQAIKRGACDYVSKPFATDVLLAKIDRLQSNGHNNGNGDKAPADAAGAQTVEPTPVAAEGQTGAPDAPGGISLKLPEAIAGVERSLIDAALRRAAGNQAKAAQFLGIPRTTLRDKLAKYGLASESGQENH
jgi:DNA-binding NtrC family response regulator